MKTRGDCFTVARKTVAIDAARISGTSLLFTAPRSLGNVVEFHKKKQNKRSSITGCAPCTHMNYRRIKVNRRNNIKLLIKYISSEKKEPEKQVSQTRISLSIS